jgi:hypothetical protein
MESGIKLESTVQRTATAPAQVSIPYDIRASFDTMTQYLLTKDKIATIRRGVASDESVVLGLSVGVCLTVASVLIPFYVSGDAVKAGKLIPFLWATLFLFFVLSVYVGVKWWRLRSESDTAIRTILEESQTVLTISKSTGIGD